MLQEICDSLNAGRDDSQKVEIVFTNNSLSKKLREALPYIWFMGHSNEMVRKLLT